MAAGFRSPLILLGFAATAVAPAADVGFRSPLAVLGISAVPQVSPTTAGYRSLLALWLGGASAPPFTPAATPSTTVQGRRHIQWESIRIGLPDNPYDDDDMVELLSIVTPLL